MSECANRYIAGELVLCSRTSSTCEYTRATFQCPRETDGNYIAVAARREQILQTLAKARLELQKRKTREKNSQQRLF